MDDHDRLEIWREALTMALYVSTVLIATFTALPKGGADSDAGVHGWELIALIWGTSLGLAIAHVFAFRVSAKAFGGGVLSAADAKGAAAQLVAAAAVAALCSVPVLFADDASDIGAATFVPAVLIGIAGYAVAKAESRSTPRALIVGGIVLVVGLAVAAVKNFLVGH